MSDFAAVWRSIQHGLTALALAALLPAQAMGSKPANEMLPAPVEGYNHTSAAINRFSVNGAGGPNVGAYQGGGSQTCCAALPRQWRRGLMATVEWQKDAKPYDSANWPYKYGSIEWIQASERHKKQYYSNHRAVVEIPRYDKSCGLNVHFLPCNQVKVVTYCGGYYGDPGYPVQGPIRMEEPKSCPK
ncbi:DUF3304 domain-containing protein [Chromobacterium haemolyticum]|uniref:DUF3304 domain-containing protein n=1 Tax=Chromobacterium haemolyticum TaxID=394935 RepID=UPI001745F839|nr:DUF3304 domain-containing protein [Chromobacterium haemolyticum]QOD81307.1 DUF3304 domain-containing protein [Chromobacterium haemolyticum]